MLEYRVPCPSPHTHCSASEIGLPRAFFSFLIYSMTIAASFNLPYYVSAYMQANHGSSKTFADTSCKLSFNDSSLFIF